MTFKFSRFAVVAFVSAVFVASAFVNILENGNTVFAEGDYVGPGSVNCGGKIMGKTVAQNPNFGILDFDSHPGLDTTGSPTDLSIVGLAPGLAPADRNLAACIDASVPLVNNTYMFRGYAWNTNLGFYSFFCNGTLGQMGKNQGVDCGNYTYSVNVGAPDGLGNRKLSGNAWNPAFGYIQLADTVGAIPYQVVADKDGKLSGWAWTEAKVWVNMAGVVIQIPGQKIVAPVVGVCDGKPFACIEVVTDPEKGLAKVLSGTNGTGGIKIGADNEVKVANGVDGYEIHLYLRDADGVTPMDLVNKYTLGNMKFTWVDSVKRTQDFSTTVGSTLDAVVNPWAQGNGGVLYKPTTNITLADHFDVVAPGHYKLKENIKSYAPTTDMNVSYTVSMKPNVPFQNETFFSKMKNSGNQIPKPEPNRLKLSNVDVPVTVKATGAVPTLADGKIYSKIIYPNGKDGLFFHFRPAVEVNTLYSGNNQDSISGFRSIPFSFMAGGMKNSGLAATANVDFILDYDAETTKSNCEDGLGETVVGNGFTIEFTNGNGGSTYSWSNVPSSFYSIDLQAVAKLPDYDNIIDEEEKAAIKPCGVVAGPSLYSVVKYTVGGNPVTYFSNHIPRTVSSITNPVAVVRGNLYAAKAFSPSAAVETQETGSKSVNIVRDGVYENITSKISGVTLDKDPNPGVKNSTSVDVVNSNPSGSVDVDGTKVVVYENKDVHINLSSADAYDNNQTIVVMNGNVFIDKDIYKPASTDKMQIIVLRPYSSGCNKGNIYVESNVKNINANVFTDCSIFSYKAGMAFDPVTGVPVWANFSEMTDSLNKQLRWFGSIASHNTVGGSDLDKDTVNPKTYLLDGFRAWDASKLTDKQKLDIQAYDLNYLRLFKLSVQTNDLGQPVDQSCKKGLTLDEMLQIEQAKLGLADFVYGVDDLECNGIDPLSPYDAESGEGDLIAPIGDTSTLAQGLTAGNYDPVYVIFSPSTSPLFKN